MKQQLLNWKTDFEKLRDPVAGKERIKKLLFQEEKDIKNYLAPWLEFSKEGKLVYPSQGLVFTPYDYLSYKFLYLLPQEMIIKTLRLRRFFLELFNHPYRIYFLRLTDKKKFKAPPKISSKAFESASKMGLSLSIGDLGATIVGSEKPRIQRSERYAQGPFVKLGKQARHIFVGSASPDIWNSAAAVATMAASHCLAAIPRNGLTKDIKRQSDLAKEVFQWLNLMEQQILKDHPVRDYISKLWRRNVSGVIEANPEKALSRAEALFNAGVRTFRIYSPEPGNGPVETTKVLRKEYKNKIEIFSGQIVDVGQAQRAEAEGADGLFIGIGGGGRCTTGLRSGLVINWPELLWQLRGKIKIPVIVEGGASDHVSITLLLGASGIGVSRVVAGGTIESPGGALYCADGNGKLFKPYGGEASARVKYLESKILPFNIPSFVEGETRKAEMSYVKHLYPTLTYNIHYLIEDAILAMVFRNAKTISELHCLNPSPIRWNTTFDVFQRNTH